MKKMLLTGASLAAASLFIYGRYVEPYQLEVKNVTVSDELNFKIVHLSDLHFGKNFNLKQLKKLINQINKIDADCIVFTGDFFDDRYDRGIDEISAVLNKLDNTIPKYAIWGNHDYKNYAFAVYESLMKRSGFELLNNESKIIEHDNCFITLVGSDDYISGDFDKYYLESINNKGYQILLLHEPDVIDYLRVNNYDLVLSGHAHGGQVNMPLGIKGRTRLGSKYQEGLYELEHEVKLYVSGGIGTTGTRLRIGVKPSITVVSI